MIFIVGYQYKSSMCMRGLPVEVVGSLGPVAAGVLGAEPGSAGWPASCAGTAAGFSGMLVGSHLLGHTHTPHTQHNQATAEKRQNRKYERSNSPGQQG